jgi:PilZ domain-containing protein
MSWMAQGRVMPVMSDVTQLLAATQIVKAVLHGLVKPSGQKFHVTAKGGDRSRRFVQWPLLKLFAGCLVLTLAGIACAFLLEDGTKLRDSSALCLFWSWYNILVLSIACVVCVEQPRMRFSERLAANDTVVVRAAGNASVYRILDLSLGGAKLWGTAPGNTGDVVALSLRDLHIPATIVRCGKGEFAVVFSHAASTRTDLIRLVYSGRYSATVPRIEPFRVAAALFGRVMR